MRKLISALSIAAAIVLAASPGHALDAPKGPVILTIRGNVGSPNVDGTAQFDQAMLEALSGRRATMETPWTEGKTEFAGPYLRSVLEAAGATGHTLVVKALNDYFAEVPAEDAASLDTILATRMNGKAMSVRDKGPLFLIYPFDLDKALYNERYFSRSVWQIKEIEVKS